MKKLLTLVMIAFAFLLLFAAASPAGELAATAADSSSGSITGNISDASGRPIAGATAQAYSCSDGTLAASAVATKDGDYVIKAPYGCYHVRFSAEGYNSSWHGDVPLRETASEIKLSGEAVKGIDSELDEAGALITGTVKTTEGKPLAGAWVSAFSLATKADTVSASDARTDGEGHFSLNVSPGSYVVIFAAKGYVGKAHGKSLLEPTTVELAEGKTVSGVDATLARGGSIIGTVTDEGGRPLKGMYAAAILAGEQALPIPLPAAVARTDAGGNYTLDGLDTGTYSIIYGDPERNYLSPRSDRGGQAPSLVVTASAVTTAQPVILKRAGRISGRVTDATGNAIAGVMVHAESSQSGSSSGITDETGAYSIPGLAAGKYNVAFNPVKGGYLRRYYRDTASAEAAIPVEVTAAQVTANIDQTLLSGHALNGTVTNSSGEPVVGAMVFVYAEGSDQFSFATTGPGGAYSVALADGAYVVAVSATGEGYLLQWSGNKSTREDAARITVSKEDAGMTLNFVLVRGASISGTVRNSTGAGIANVAITATDAITGEDSNSTVSDMSGRYTITTLTAGSYRLTANGTSAGYIETKVPQPIAVTAGAPTENIDIVLAAGGSIAGKVTDRDGNPIPGVEAAAYDPVTWDEVATASTDGSGHYKIGGLPENRYRIRFEKEGLKYPIQWYRGKFRRGESAPVEVAGTSAVDGIDVILRPGVRLSGTVTGANGAPLPNTHVEVYGVTEDESFAEVGTDADGKYAIPSLAPGSYRIRFSHDKYVPRWYGGSDRRSAAAVTVKDTEMGAVNATLAMASGKFSGKLMNPEGQKRGEAWVTAVDAATGVAVADEMICQCSGEFHTPVPGGLYKLRVERHGQIIWFGGKNEEEAVPLQGKGDIGGLDMVIEDSVVKVKQASKVR